MYIVLYDRAYLCKKLIIPNKNTKQISHIIIKLVIVQYIYKFIMIFLTSEKKFKKVKKKIVSSNNFHDNQ